MLLHADPVSYLEESLALQIVLGLRLRLGIAATLLFLAALSSLRIQLRRDTTT